MEQALEGADAVHRVKLKPGPKPKAVMASFKAPVGNTYKIESINVHPDDAAAQAYAMRVWSGQSIDVSIPDRVARVVAALRDQGLDINVTLPHPDAARFLAKHK